MFFIILIACYIFTGYALRYFGVKNSRGPAKGIIDYVIFFIVWFGTTFLVYSIYGYIFI